MSQSDESFTVHIEDDHGFTAVPNSFLMDPDKDIYELGVYTALRSFADYGRETGAHPSQASIAVRAGCSARTVWDRLRRLRKKGWIDWKTVTNDTGTRNDYTVRSYIGRSHEVRKGLRTGRERGFARGAKGASHEVRTTKSQRPRAIDRDGSDATHPAAPARKEVPNGDGGAGREGPVDLRPEVFPNAEAAAAVMRLLWMTDDRRPPPKAPPGWHLGRDLQVLGEFYRVRGRAFLEYLRGVRIMVEDGELAGIGLTPGTGFTAAMLQQLEGRDETSLWARAMTAAYKNDDRFTQPALDQVVQLALRG